MCIVVETLHATSLHACDDNVCRFIVAHDFLIELIRPRGAERPQQRPSGFL